MKRSENEGNYRLTNSQFLFFECVLFKAASGFSKNTKMSIGRHKWTAGKFSSANI